MGTRLNESQGSQLDIDRTSRSAKLAGLVPPLREQLRILAHYAWKNPGDQGQHTCSLAVSR